MSHQDVPERDTEFPRDGHGRFVAAASGGYSQAPLLVAIFGTGGRYNPSTDTWTAMSTCDNLRVGKVSALQEDEDCWHSDRFPPPTSGSWHSRQISVCSAGFVNAPLRRSTGVIASGERRAWPTPAHSSMDRHTNVTPDYRHHSGNCTAAIFSAMSRCARNASSAVAIRLMRTRMRLTSP
jgi:hypothetical protein